MTIQPSTDAAAHPSAEPPAQPSAKPPAQPFTQDEIGQFRADTPGTSQHIHFNNAGASFPPQIVLDAMFDYLKEEATHGGYETEARYTKKFEETYDRIARLINADRDEIAIVENASQGWHHAFNGIDWQPGDQVITSEMEYISNLLGFLHVKANSGIDIIVVANDEHDNFSIAALEAAITPKTRMIAITHIPSTAGAVLPIEEIGVIARKHNILYLVDACQTVGQIPIDVKAIGCDMLAVTGRKFLRAPRGTGFLYVRKAVQNQLRIFFLDGFTAKLINETEYEIRQDAKRFELYEKNRALTLGLSAAVEYALNAGIDRIWQRVQHLATTLRQQLSAIEGVTVHDKGDTLCGIVTFSVAAADAYTVKILLAEKGINVTVAISKSALLYMNRHHLSSAVRASIHYYNTEEEISRFCDAIRAISN